VPDGTPDAPDITLGVGLSSGADAAELAGLVAGTLAAAGIARDRVARVATVDTRADHPALAGLGWPVVSFSPAALAAEGGASRGRGVAVAEPAAMLAAGPGAVLLVPKRRSARATVAVARAERPPVAHTPSRVRR
jgi:cobalamin biosynthesis protein CbiG